MKPENFVKKSIEGYAGGERLYFPFDENYRYTTPDFCSNEGEIWHRQTAPRHTQISSSSVQHITGPMPAVLGDYF